MATFKTTTGLGYLKDVNGNITDKCHFAPDSEHEVKDGYTFIEVADMAELDTVAPYVSPKPPEQILEEKIQAEIRAIAIERLKAKGEL